MFTSIHPVCPTTDLVRTVEFWSKRGVPLVFTDHDDLTQASYAGVRRGIFYLHLQTFTREQLGTGGTISIRTFVKDLADLESLYEEWKPVGVDSPLALKPWYQHEFGFYDPDGTALFFCASA